MPTRTGITSPALFARQPHFAPNHNIDVIDIGLSLGEALGMDLQTEIFYRKNALPSALVLNDLEKEKFTGTKRIGSNKDKAVWKAERVELNALARDPDRFIEWVEQKLAEHGVAKKLVPPADVITRMARNKRSSLLQDRISEIVGEILDVDSIVAAVIEDHLDDIPIEHMPNAIQAWGRKLRPERWTDRIQRLVEDAIYDIRDQIRATAEVRTSEILEDLT